MALEMEVDLLLSDLKGRDRLDSQLVCAILSGVDSAYALPYDFVFIKGLNGFFLRVDSAERGEFLNLCSNEQAEENIKDLTKRVRKITGGYYDIHPFMGALWHSSRNPIIPGFGEGSMFDGLNMILHLRDNGDHFDSQEMFTQVALNADTWIKGKDIATFFESRMRADRINPNGSNRDQAIANGLGVLWSQEFNKFNDEPKPRAMEVTHSSLYSFTKKLAKLGIGDLRLKRLTYEE